MIRSILYYFVNSLYTVPGFVPCHPHTSGRRGQSAYRNGRVTHPTIVLDIFRTKPRRRWVARRSCGWYPALNIQYYYIDLRTLRWRSSLQVHARLYLPPCRFTEPFKSLTSPGIHHGPTKCPKTTPRPRQSFATVPQTPQQLPSQRRVSKCSSEPARRRFVATCRVFR